MDVDRNIMSWDEQINIIFDYVVLNKYPEQCDKNKKANIRFKSKPYFAKSGELFYRKKDKNSNVKELLVIREKEARKRIIETVHSGAGDSDEAQCLAGHLGIHKTRDKILNRFFWKGLSHDVEEYITACERCQKVNPRLETPRAQLHSVNVPYGVMRQIGVDITQLPPSDDGYRYVVMAVDYFSKWPEARPLKDKTALSVASFLFEDIICRHGCIEIQINDQGREFVNGVSEELFRLSGTKQHITSAYHPQANGLVERQNRTLKDCLVKCLVDKSNWPSCLPSALFSCRPACHSSTKFAPFTIVYGREARLPVDVEHSVNELPDQDIGQNGVIEFMEQMDTIRAAVFDSVSKNIKDAQEQQKAAYDKRHSPELFAIDDRVLLKNLVRHDRKGGKFTERWTGPYQVAKVCGKNTYLLKGEQGLLKKKQNGVNLKTFKEASSNQFAATLPPAEQESPPKKRRKSVEFLKEDECDSIPFVPVCIEWQRDACIALGLKVIRPNSSSHGTALRISHDISPKTVRIKGDGNCLFRALSFVVCGSQEEHSIFRQMITSYMEANEDVMATYVPDVSSYLATSDMRNSGVWGTDVEINAASELLGTTIYVLSPYGRNLRWLLFKPTTPSASRHKDEAIYLVNQSHHFEPLKRL